MYPLELDISGEQHQNLKDDAASPEVDDQKAGGGYPVQFVSWFSCATWAFGADLCLNKW